MAPSRKWYGFAVKASHRPGMSLYWSGQSHTPLRTPQTLTVGGGGVGGQAREFLNWNRRDRDDEGKKKQKHTRTEVNNRGVERSSACILLHIATDYNSTLRQADNWDRDKVQQGQGELCTHMA
jgi:hypothetical protein